ncbi:S-adenosyl-L-methionine-dependent methyltransferase [Aspergillus falconensis]
MQPDNNTITALINELATLSKNQNASAPLVSHDPSRKRALQLARKLTVALERPQTVPLNSVLPIPGAVARIALDLNLFDVLAETPDGNTLAGLAGRVGADPVLLSRFDVALPVIASLPSYFRSTGHVFPGDETNGPFQHAYNTTLSAFDWWGQDPALSANFNTFMTGTAGAGKKSHWVNWFPVQEHLLDEARRDKNAVLLVDVGGGRGHDLVTFLTKFCDAPGRAILQDLPGVIDDYQPDDVWGERIEPVKHSFFDVQPIQNARIYFLHHVLHNWPDEKAVLILANIASAMEKGGYSRLIIVENCLPDRECPLWKAEMDWLMMATHCGMQRTVKEFAVLCERAGLRMVKYWAPRGDGDGVVEAVRE